LPWHFTRHLDSTDNPQAQEVALALHSPPVPTKLTSQPKHNKMTATTREDGTQEKHNSTNILGNTTTATNIKTVNKYVSHTQEARKKFALCWILG